MQPCRESDLCEVTGTTELEQEWDDRYQNLTRSQLASTTQLEQETLLHAGMLCTVRRTVWMRYACMMRNSAQHIAMKVAVGLCYCAGATKQLYGRELRNIIKQLTWSTVSVASQQSMKWCQALMEHDRDQDTASIRTPPVPASLPEGAL